jgi:ABC-type transport system involved in multi-copper enzyme maturation permease subunit
MRLIRSEFLKIRTTNLWWLFLLGALGLLLLAFTVNAFQLDFVLDPPENAGLDAQTEAQFAVLRTPAAMTSFLVTSGQYFGLMFVLLIGIITVTNEFHHQTATTTFLASPHRTSVILAKTVAAGVFGVILWAITTAINIPATLWYLNFQDAQSALGDAAVQRAIALNLVAYILWALIGVGIGVLIRSQIGATVTAMVLYTVGTIAVAIIVQIFINQFGWDWADNLQWAFPSIASGLMVNGVDIPNQPHYWVGGLILLAWALVTGLIGTLITRTRDIS